MNMNVSVASGRDKLRMYNPNQEEAIEYLVCTMFSGSIHVIFILP